MVDIKQAILEWRYNQDSILKTTVGLWIKGGYEAFLMLGIPLGMILLAFDQISTITIDMLPLVPEVDAPLWAIWILTCLAAEYKERCLLTLGTDYP
jgi:hypothetical protein